MLPTLNRKWTSPNYLHKHDCAPDIKTWMNEFGVWGKFAPLLQFLHLWDVWVFYFFLPIQYSPLVTPQHVNGIKMWALTLPFQDSPFLNFQTILLFLKHPLKDSRIGGHDTSASRVFSWKAVFGLCQTCPLFWNPNNSIFDSSVQRTLF